MPLSLCLSVKGKSSCVLTVLLSSPGLGHIMRLSSAQCLTKMARFALKEGNRTYLNLHGQASQWVPHLTCANVLHGNFWVTFTVTMFFYRLIYMIGMSFLLQHLETGNLRFIYFSESLNLPPRKPEANSSTEYLVLSPKNPFPPSKESYSNPGLSQGQETKWGTSFGTAVIPLSFLVVDVSWFPGNAEMSSQWTLVLREPHCSFQGWRAQSTLYRSPNSPQGGSCPTLKQPLAQLYPCSAQQL